MKISLVISTAAQDVSIDVVDNDTERPTHEQRVRIEFGDVSIFIQRCEIPDFVMALMPLASARVDGLAPV